MEKQIQSNELIWIDTSTIMDIENFKLFITKIRPLLLKKKKMIIIPISVKNELLKHKNSDNQKKKNLAIRGLELINQYKDIFQYDQTINNLANDNFADKNILLLIINNKTEASQLLISNDKGLTSDAYKFNDTKSYNGRKINVCYINRNGNLQMCDCVKNKVQEIEKNVQKDNVAPIQIEVTKDKTFLERYGLPVGVLIGSFTTYVVCNRKNIFNSLKQLKIRWV